MTEQLSFSEQLSYYLAERLGEAVGGPGLLAAVFVLIALLVRNPKACVIAGVMGAMVVPVLHLLQTQIGYNTTTRCATVCCGATH